MGSEGTGRGPLLSANEDVEEVALSRDVDCVRVRAVVMAIRRRMKKKKRKREKGKA